MLVLPGSRVATWLGLQTREAGGRIPARRAGTTEKSGERKPAAYAYLTATLHAATWGAELAVGAGPGRIYVVEVTGPFEDAPNLTDQKFPGNPPKSYRTRAPLRVVGEVVDWAGHSAKQIGAMRDGLAELARLGVEAIED